MQPRVTPEVAYIMKGLVASAGGMTDQGGRLAVAGMEDAREMYREPDSKPVKQVPPSGVVAFSVEATSEDPDFLGREVWCVAGSDDDFTIERKLTTASLEFTCDAEFVDVVCTECDGDECIEVEEVLNEDLAERIAVDVEWTGVGSLMRDMSVNKSSDDDSWELSHTMIVHREAIATGTVVGATMGTIFDGEFEYAQLANVRDGSIKRGEMVP